MKHTQGKWKVTGSGHRVFTLAVVAEDGGSICHISTWPEQNQNAKLIAAAPELLEALKYLKKRYEELVDCGDCGNWNPREDEEVIKANQAIKTAES